MLQSNPGYASTRIANDDAVMDRIMDSWVAKGGHQFDLAILILASLNAVAAGLMIGSILYDARSNREWDFFLKARGHFKYLPTINSAHVFPVVFGITVIFQSVVFIAINVAESHNRLSRTCQTIAQLIWPVLWIAPYTMLFFGLETTFRSLQRKAFSSQSRRHFWFCIVGILLLTIITWIPSAFSPTKGKCVTSLIWWTFHYARAGVAICLVLIFAFVTSASVITFQLLGTTKIDRGQRVQASRIVYHLIASTLILSLILPYYVEVIMMKPAINAAKLAAVAANTTGLIPAFFHILLRSNADWTMIRAIGNSWWPKKRTLRISDSADMDMYDHMTSPVSLQAKHSPTLADDPEKSPIKSPSWPQVPKFQSQSTNIHIPALPSNAVITLPSKINLTRIKTPNRTYSIFPAYGLALTRESVSTTFSQGEEVIEMPKPLFAEGHKRAFSGQSNATSATVQIGLRMSFPSHGLDPSHQSHLGYTRDIPFRSSIASDGSLPHNRGTMSRRPESKNPGSDISILPIHSNETRTPSQVLGPRANLLSPNWIFRKGSNSGSAQPMDRDVMKSLPPDPTGEASPGHDSRAFPKTFKAGWRHEAASFQQWI